ncbi:MAG: hypothetical protein P8X48_03090 [Acidiferrobacteraceae bacterium]|jgi:hypothetical protein
MLSHLYRLIRAFETRHGYRPNILTIHPRHYSELRDSLPAYTRYLELTRFLGMRVVLSSDSIHPHVSWSAVAERDSA